MWFLFIERKPKTEDKQTIAMLRSKIYTLEQELEQQKNQKVCWGVPNCVDYTIFQWGCLLGLKRMNFAERGRWQIDEEFLQTYFKICLQDPRISYIVNPVVFSIRGLQIYKPTLFRERENFARFTRASSSQNFFATNQPLWYCCNISMDLDTAYSRKLVIAKQFLSSKLQSSVVANKSWSTVLFYYSLFESTRE